MSNNSLCSVKTLHFFCVKLFLLVYACQQARISVIIYLSMLYSVILYCEKRRENMRTSMTTLNSSHTI